MTPAAFPTPPIGELLPMLSRDVIEAIADRPNEPETRRHARAQCAMRMIEGFEPEDGVEIMLAGQTVLMRTLVLDSIHDSQRAETKAGALRLRREAVSIARMQLAFLKEFGRHRADQSQPIEQAPAETASPPQAAAEAPQAVVPEPEHRAVPVQPAAAQPVPSRAAVPAPDARQAQSPSPQRMPPSFVAVPARPAAVMTG